MNGKLSIVVWLGLALIPAGATAQTPAPAQPAPGQAAPGQAAPGQPAPATNVPTGTPEGVSRMAPHNSRGFPAPRTVEGQPIETRPPELAGDRPVFPGQTRAPYHATAPYQVTTITDQLKLPWALAFLPDGKMLVTEKSGRMRIVDEKGTLSQPLTGVPEVAFRGQAGLMDLALDPKFSSNQRIFFTYFEPVTMPGSPIPQSTLVVAHARLDEAAGSLSDVTVIFRAKPTLPVAMSANVGGRIAIGRDGNIFAVIGDHAGSPPWDMAQRLNSDLGKIIHITPDGAPVKDNPFLNKTGILPEIWSYGHRSEECLTIDPATGQLWEAEDGPRGGDKLIRVEAGQNYGWPLYVHGIDYPGELIANGAVEAAGTQQPVYYWDPVIAPSGLAFYRGNLFPQWKGSLFIGGLRAQFLDRLTISDGKVVNEEPLLVDQHARIRDVRVNAAGAVYVLTDSGKLLKLTPK